MQLRSTPSPGDTRTPFQRFQDLARRILTTPKAELVKERPKAKAGKPKPRK